MNMFRRSFRAALLIGAAASTLAFAVGARANDKDDHDKGSDDNSAPHGNPWPYAAPGKSPVLAVVGDIACQPGTEVTGEAGSEVCTDPSASKGNFSAASKTSLWQSQEATANQIEAMKPAAVALLGDLQYQVGRYSDFEGSFDLTYGAFKFLHRPSPGNHEFYDEHGQTGVAGYGYFSYYNGLQACQPINTTNCLAPFLGSASGVEMTTVPDPCPTAPPAVATACGYLSTNSAPSLQPIPRTDGQAGLFSATGGPGSTMANPIGLGEGWYSYNIGSWHLISLNIECSTQQANAEGCPTLDAVPSKGSWLDSELTWLEKDLEADDSACTLAYWHQPTFSAANSIAPEGVAAKLFWEKLYEHKADLVLNGHDHLYARYRPLEPDGTPDRERGIREFIVGTGGETLDPVAITGTASYPGLAANPNFNSQNLEAYTGDYWGVMALTLDPNGYHWDFEAAPGVASPILTFTNPLLNGPTLQPTPAPDAPSYSDTGFAFCHNSNDKERHDDDHDHDH